MPANPISNDQGCKRKKKKEGCRANGVSICCNRLSIFSNPSSVTFRTLRRQGPQDRWTCSEAGGNADQDKVSSETETTVRSGPLELRWFGLWRSSAGKRTLSISMTTRCSVSSVTSPAWLSTMALSCRAWCLQISCSGSGPTVKAVSQSHGRRR
jgi:hypothetical protein